MPCGPSTTCGGSPEICSGPTGEGERHTPAPLISGYPSGFGARCAVPLPPRIRTFPRLAWPAWRAARGADVAVDARVLLDLLELRDQLRACVRELRLVVARLGRLLLHDQPRQRHEPLQVVDLARLLREVELTVERADQTLVAIRRWRFLLPLLRLELRLLPAAPSLT
jgi:hypothetical protein